MLEKIREFYGEILDRAKREVAPFSSSTMSYLMSSEIGNVLSSIASQGDNASDAAKVLSANSSANSEFSQRMASGDGGTMSNYNMVAFSPIYQMFQSEPEKTMFSLMGHVSDAGAESAGALAESIDEIIPDLETIAAVQSVDGFKNDSGQAKVEIYNATNKASNKIDEILEDIENGDQIDESKILDLRSTMDVIGKAITSRKSILDAAAAKASINNLIAKAPSIEDASIKADGIKSGFGKMKDPTNLVPLAAGGSLYSEHAKILSNLQDMLFESQVKIQTSETVSDFAEVLPGVASTSMLGAAVTSGEFGRISMDPSKYDQDMIDADSAFSKASSELSGIGSLSVSGLSDAVANLSAVFNQAINTGNSTALVSLAMNMVASLQGTSVMAKAVQVTMQAFSDSNSVSSPLLDSYMQQAQTSNMENLYDTIIQGKIGDGLFGIDDTNITKADEAFGELRDLSFGLTENNKMMAITNIANRYRDEKRRHVYASITYEESKQAAETEVDRLKQTQDEELRFLEEMARRG